MIVYGDPSAQESFRTLLERLEESLSAARTDSLDAVRGALIRAGMIEQGLEDAGDEALAAPCRTVTDRLAEALVDLYRSPGGRLVRTPTAFGAFTPCADPLLTLKLPEGFAFYALYPESYVFATERWRFDHATTERVAVIGVRSIGTTLSALVAASLRAQGVKAHRITLRPTGHPFAREARLAPEALGDATHVLIVDEGPGLSGSSIAAAAGAAHAAGVARDRIAFLPGHGNDPGGMASEEVRRWWREAPRYAVPTEALRWDGRTLEETLADHAGDAVGVEELTGGRWRARVYASEAEWPAVALPFERRKLLATRADGSAVMYKFVGLTEPGTILGFAPAPWIDGQPLTLADATPELLADLGRHIAAVARPPLSPSETGAAHDRLARMLRHNAEEAGLEPLSPLGERGWGEGSEGPSSGDYRLAPHEWRRLSDGGIVKAGRIAPAGDHTVVGHQPIAWDVAGVMVEWDLDELTAKPLLEALAERGIPTEEPERRFYRAAYAAFMMGLCAHCAPLAREGERPRLEAARSRYRTALSKAALERL